MMADTDRPVGELVKELSEQTSRLVRQELELARLELTEKGKRAGIGAGMFGGAGLVSAYAVGALMAAVVLLLATAMTAWLAAAVVAAGLGVIAGVLALTGRAQVERAVPPVPEQASESMKEDVRWAKQSAKAGRA
jgi:uncharacterized membrane protein YqjE